MPFMDRVGIVFLACLTIGVVVSIVQGQGEQAKAIDYESVDTSTSSSFNLAAAVIAMLLIALYATWW
jgi:SSS family solute:Na+ symporter